MRFGHTDLSVGVSGSKLDAEADFEVRFAFALPKPYKIHAKVIFLMQKYEKFLKALEGVRTHLDAPKRIWVHPNVCKRVCTRPKESKNFRNR